MRILIVEDERKLIDILQRSLRSEGYAVDGVLSAAAGLDYARTYHYDLVIIDLQLPDGTGTSLLRQIREFGQTMPVLILTARSDLESKVENFQAGADDYVVKPVAMAELNIRVQALLRRGPVLQENVLRAAGDPGRRLPAFYGGEFSAFHAAVHYQQSGGAQPGDLEHGTGVIGRSGAPHQCD